HPARHTVLPRYLDYLRVASPGIADCWWLLSTTPCHGPKMAANVALLLDKLPHLHEADDLAVTVIELREAAKVGPERAKAWPSEEVYERIKAAFEKFRAELPDKLRLFTETPEDLAEAVRTGQRFVRVAAEAERTYQQLKRRHSVLDFQDLLVLARDLLQGHAAVRERLQKRWCYLLIDELQDTDPVQMQIVELLC